VYRWIVFLHIAGIFAFLLSHGSSAGVAFALRHEQKPERIRALLQLSGSAIPVFYASLVVLIASGVISAFMGHWWRQGWIWASIVVLILMITAMWTIGSRQYHQVRKAIGMGYMQGMKFLPAEKEQASPEELEALLARGRPYLLTAIGYGGALVIAALMWFKPA
jgi:hypothetical protein